MSNLQSWIELDGTYTIRGLTREEHQILVGIAEGYVGLLDDLSKTPTKEEQEVIDFLTDEENVFSEGANEVYGSMQETFDKLKESLREASGFDNKTILDAMKNSLDELT